MHTPLRSRFLILGAIAGLALGCKDNAPDPNILSIAGGGTQSKIAGTPSDVMRVLVTNTAGLPVVGATVTWTSTSGDLAATSTTTDDQGIVSNTLTDVGDVTGLVTVTASTAGGSEAEFSITVNPEPPGRLERFSGDPTNTGAGASDTIRVRVLDYLDAPEAGVAVRFSVTAGNGTVSQATVTTDAQGIAATRWTRGTAGPNSVSVSAAGYDNSPVSFSVSVVSQVASLRFEPRVIVIDEGGQTFTSAAITRDGAGVAFTSPNVTYVSRNLAVVSVDTEGLLTATGSGQAMVVAMVPGPNNVLLRDSALVVVATEGGPVLMTDLDQFDFAMDSTITVTIRADMRASTETLGSGRVTITWDPGVLTYVSHAEGADAVGATVNTNNATSGTILLAFANATGFGGDVELRRITFRAATTARSGTLTVAANEMYSASTFQDLMSLVTSVATPLFTR